MWCLVSQANSVILEVQVDPKAIGQVCLEKVSHFTTVAFFICLPYSFVRAYIRPSVASFVTSIYRVFTLLREIE